jgi:hypothetical protein
MYFTKNRVNLYRFVPIFTIFMFRPLQKKFFLTDKILKIFFCKKLCCRVKSTLFTNQIICFQKRLKNEIRSTSDWSGRIW